MTEMGKIESNTLLSNFGRITLKAAVFMAI